MNTIKTLGLAAVAALALGAGGAMAQEGPNDTISGSTDFGDHPPVVAAPLAQGQAGQPGMVQSGSSDVQGRSSPGNGHYYWTPGVAY